MAEVRDVAVVGGGVLGLATAAALARRGRDVVVLEQAEVGHAGAGSKGSCRIFRLGYPDPGYVRAARRAGELWRELESQSGRQIRWPTPQLTFGARLQDVQAALQQAGAPGTLLPAAAVAERFPAVRVAGPALLEPESAVIAASVALEVLAAAAGEVRTGVRVTSLSDNDSRVTVRTTAGAVAARTVVVAAGPWSGGLLATMGVAVPIRPTLEQVAYLSPAADFPAGAAAPIFLCHAGQAPYGLPVPGSPFYKIGLHPSGPVTDPAVQDQSPDRDLLARLADIATRYLPGYQAVPAATERCVYDNTPDEDFIVDRVGNVVIGCGTSGHGFKFGPLLGDWLAALATGDEMAPDWLPRDRFAVGRFRAGLTGP